MLRILQHQTLQQKMAPQLIQSLRLLQMSTLELEMRIKQEMELNPLLEEGPSAEADSEESETGLDEGLREEEELPREAEEVDWDTLLGDQFDLGEYNSERTEYDPNWEVDREPRENRITAIPPLTARLHEQLALSSLSPAQREIGAYIIGSIDERGYLGCSTEDLAEMLRLAASEVEKVLKVVQGFEPPGVGARDLRECLMIQLQQRKGELRDLALRVVGDHMEDLTRRRFGRITRALGISDDELKAVLDLIESLQPYPGSPSSSDYSGLLTLDTEVSYITPDLVVEKVGDEWVVSLTDGTLPSLRISGTYSRMLRDSRRNGKDEVQDYLAKKINDARWLINAIQQRRTTMLKVANYLVRMQLPFFEKGPAYLKPMVLQDVADKVEMHVSTISRVSNGKYMQTPYGVFELKYFFDGRVSTESGEDVSTRNVKEHISRLIAGEDKANPLSDQKIADELGRKGLQIARRTVAKYRDQLGINSQRYRKSF
jgi:RNA polymerase sigma-54 factor